MAQRDVYETFDRAPFVRSVSVNFEWYAGFSTAQKRRSIASLHGAYLVRHPGRSVLEISSKSEEELGVALSAFNLMLRIEGRDVPVECAFQAGKVFEHGGPYADLLGVSPREAKRDARLRESGRMTGFSLMGEEFPADARDAYYRWIYLRQAVAQEIAIG